MGEKRRFLFVQSRDLLHILRGELEIEYLEVFFHPLFSDAFRDLLNPADRLTDIWNSPGNKSDIKLEIVPFMDTVNALENIYERFGEFFDVMIGSCDIKGYSAYFSVGRGQALSGK